MAFPDVSAVHQKFRLVAYTLVGFWALAVIASLGSSLLTIWIDRDNPQTQNHVYSLGGSDRWGSMPDLIFVERSYLHVEKKDWENYVWPIDVYSMNQTGSTPPFFVLYGNSLILNVSMLNPQFHRIGQHAIDPTIVFSLPAKTDVSFSFYFRAKGGTEQFAAHMTLDVSQMNCLNYIYVEKNFVPKVGVFWGYPREGNNVVPEYRLDGPHCQHYSVLTKPVFYLMIKQKTIMYIEPVSLIKQIATAFQAVGASVALLGTIFALVFQRRFPRSVEEADSVQMTLRGYKEKSRPTHSKSQTETLQKGLLCT